MSWDGFEFSPLRSLDDFILGSARFQLPNFRDLEKWGNRVVNNLLYYQSNYFFMGIIIFLCVGVLHPVKILGGTIGIIFAFALFSYFSNMKSEVIQFKKKYPLVGVILVLLGGYLAVYLMDSVLVFFFGILLPICITFIHASMRLRSIRNKLSNKIEIVGLKKTPMGSFLTVLANLDGIPGWIRTPLLAKGPAKASVYKAMN